MLKDRQISTLENDYKETCFTNIIVEIHEVFIQPKRTMGLNEEDLYDHSTEMLTHYDDGNESMLANSN